jgi:hypothetical protein
MRLSQALILIQARYVLRDASLSAGVLLLAGGVLLFLPLLQGIHAFNEWAPEFMVWIAPLFAYHFAHHLAHREPNASAGHKEDFPTLERAVLLWLLLIVTWVTALALLMWSLVSGVSVRCAYPIALLALVGLSGSYTGLSSRVGRLGAFLILSALTVLAAVSNSLVLDQTREWLGFEITAVIAGGTLLLAAVSAFLLRGVARRDWQEG